MQTTTPRKPPVGSKLQKNPDMPLNLFLKWYGAIIDCENEQSMIKLRY